MISTGENSRRVSSKGKEPIGGVMGRSIRVASRKGCCMEEASGVLRRTIATRGSTGKTRNMERVSISGAMG